MRDDRFALTSMETLLARPPEVLPLSDGRVLTYNRFGATGGRRVLWLHGSPSCRLEAIVFHDWATRNGVSIVSFDRPGLGHAAPCPGLTVRDVADDAIALVDALGWERFTVLGGSAGGPYTLAVAHAAPTRLDGVAILAGGGVDAEAPEASGWVDRSASVLSRNVPFVLAVYFSLIGLALRLPVGVLSRMARWLPSPEAVPMRNLRFAQLFQSINAITFQQGVTGAVEDYRRLGSDWGFSIRDITTHVIVIQGTADASIPPRQAEHFAAAIPDAALHLTEGEGHFDAIFNWDRVASLLGWT